MQHRNHADAADTLSSRLYPGRREGVDSIDASEQRPSNTCICVGIATTENCLVNGIADGAVCSQAIQSILQRDHNPAHSGKIVRWLCFGPVKDEIGDRSGQRVSGHEVGGELVELFRIAAFFDSVADHSGVDAIRRDAHRVAVSRRASAAAASSAHASSRCTPAIAMGRTRIRAPLAWLFSFAARCAAAAGWLVSIAADRAVLVVRPSENGREFSQATY